jgi:hypothetical protein
MIMFEFNIEQFTLTIWNPIVQVVEHIVRVPVTKNYTIRNPTGETVAADVRMKNNSVLSIISYF